MEGFAGKVAVVTGAGSGIGQALAIELARSGARVAISDVNTEGLAATEERLKAIGAQVTADRLDVTEREAFELYADAVKEHFGKVNQIYNNAGIAFAGDVEVSPGQRSRRPPRCDPEIAHSRPPATAAQSSRAPGSEGAAYSIRLRAWPGRTVPATRRTATPCLPLHGLRWCNMNPRCTTGLAAQHAIDRTWCHA